MTALIVARPALRGESLGLVSDLSDPGGLIWTSFVLAGCGAWAAWRLWSRREAVHIGRVEVALLIGVGLLFAGAGFAAYRRAALLGCWEWAGLLLVLFLTRQLTTTEREKHGLYAVLLATGVALSVQGLYQSLWEIPRDRAQALQHKDGPRAWVGNRFEYITLESVSDGERELLTQRLLHANAHASYLYPSSLAAVLALMLPCLVAAAVVAVRGEAETWQYSVAIACALAGALALLLTGAWFALLAALLACVVLIGRGRALAWVGGLALVGIVGGVLYASGALHATLMQRAEVWRATWKVLQGHFWTGVGPGHFGFYSPMHMRETDGAPAIDANSAALDLWAAGGFLFVVVCAAAAFFLVTAVLRWWRVATPAEREEATTPGTELPWEFYLGGMMGVLSAFVLRTSPLAESDIVDVAVLAALGALAWFAAYALFEQVVWTPGERVLALSCGVGAMGLALLFGPGADRPAVMALLFVAVGLLLAHVEPVPSSLLSRPGLALGLPVPLFLAGAFAFFLLVVVPVVNTATVTRRARLSGFVFKSQYVLGGDEVRRMSDPLRYLRENVLEPLRLADLEEKGVVRTNGLLAEWLAEEWARTLLQPRSDDVQRAALAYAAMAQRACSDSKGQPVGTEGLLIEFGVRQLFAQRLLAIAAQLEKEANDPKQKMPPAQKTDTLRVAASRRSQARDAVRKWSLPLIEAIRQRDPTNPRLAYLLAQTWDTAGDTARRGEAVAEALRLDDSVGEARKLSNTQRGQLEAWEKQETPK